jgi:microcystin-dependent protein
MEIGAIYLFAGSAAPSGFLMCDGSDVSRTTYADLFSVIGSAFGTGDGSTTFNLPNLSGRVPVGSTSGMAFASTGGEESHTLTSSEIPEHTHTIPQHGHTDDISFKTPVLVHSITSQPSYNYSAPNGTVNSGVSDSDQRCYKGTSSANAGRSGNVSITAHSESNCTMSGGVTDCVAFSMDNAGSGVAHNNMMPYITLNYVIYAGGN